MLRIIGIGEKLVKPLTGEACELPLFPYNLTPNTHPPTHENLIYLYKSPILLTPPSFNDHFIVKSSRIPMLFYGVSMSNNLVSPHPKPYPLRLLYTFHPTASPPSIRLNKRYSLTASYSDIH